MNLHNINRQASQSLVSLLLLSFVVVTLSSCQPVRRKFTRKKVAKESKFIPVLDPQSYIPEDVDTVKQYKYHYSLWKVWYRELYDNLSHKGKDKRQKYLLSQMLINLEKMKNFVQGDALEYCAEGSRQLLEISNQLEKPSAMRNYYNMQQDLRSHEKYVRHNLSPEIILGSD